jgi:hypothetical protein
LLNPRSSSKASLIQRKFRIPASVPFAHLVFASFSVFFGQFLPVLDAFGVLLMMTNADMKRCFLFSCLYLFVLGFERGALL